MTGLEPFVLVVKTFRYRQSSWMLVGPANGPSVVTCGHVSANSVASSRSCFAGGAGGIQRKSPTGGAANGIPKNLFTPFSTKPRTGPSVVLTVGPSAFLICPGAFGLGPGVPPGAAIEGPEASTAPARAVAANI